MRMIGSLAWPVATYLPLMIGLLAWSAERGSQGVLARRIDRLANEGWLRWFVLLGLIALAMIGAYMCRVDQEVSLQAGTGVLPPTDIRVAMVTHGGIGDPFWDEVAAGAFAAQREFGVELFYDGDGNVNEQVRLVDNAVALGYDVLIVSLADPDALEQSIRSAVAAGLLVMDDQLRRRTWTRVWCSYALRSTGRCSRSECRRTASHRRRH